MIVGVSSADSLRETIRGQRLWAGLAAIALLVLLTLIVGHAAIGPAAPAYRQLRGGQRDAGSRPLIFTRYVFPFEVTSALLITAALGAMVLAHRERTQPEADPARPVRGCGWRAAHPTPLPGPGDLRPAQRGGLPGAAARRHPVGAVGQPGHLRAPRRAAGGQRGAPEAAGALPPARQARPSPAAGQPDGPASRVPRTRRQRAGGGAVMSPGHYVALAVILFVIGAVGVLIRRNAIVIFMCIELMLNAVNLAFVAFARHARQPGRAGHRVLRDGGRGRGRGRGGLAILMAIFRARRSASVDDANLLKY